jgi:hypothetical protein
MTLSLAIRADLFDREAIALVWWKGPQRTRLVERLHAEVEVS